MKTKSKKPKKQSYRQLQSKYNELLTANSLLGDKNFSYHMELGSNKKTIERLEAEVAEARHDLTRQREATGLYFAAISNPVTAKDAERIAGLQSQIFRSIP
jgi:hypothetical protein